MGGCCGGCEGADTLHSSSPVLAEQDLAVVCNHRDDVVESAEVDPVNHLPPEHVQQHALQGLVLGLGVKVLPGEHKARLVADLR